MSSWLSLETFMRGKTASYIRRGLFLICAYGVGSDYYLTHYYHAFDPSNGKLYVIDWTPIGRPRCQMYILPNNHYPNYSPWTPKNGDVVLAREVMTEPNWLQLISGRFVERETCGARLAIPLEEIQQQQKEREEQEESVKKLL